MKGFRDRVSCPSPTGRNVKYAWVLLLCIAIMAGLIGKPQTRGIKVQHASPAIRVLNCNLTYGTNHFASFSNPLRTKLRQLLIRLRLPQGSLPSEHFEGASAKTHGLCHGLMFRYAWREQPSIPPELCAEIQFEHGQWRSLSSPYELMTFSWPGQSTAFNSGCASLPQTVMNLPSLRFVRRRV